MDGRKRPNCKNGEGVMRTDTLVLAFIAFAAIFIVSMVILHTYELEAKLAKACIEQKGNWTEKNQCMFNE